MVVQDFLARNTVFNRDEFAVACGYDPVGDRVLVDKRLAYHQKQGRIERIRRGLYASRVGGRWADHFVVATKAAPDAVVAYHSALELHGRAYSVFFRVTFCTSLAVRAFEFDGTLYGPVGFPGSLDTDEKRSFGVVNTGRAGGSVRVTDHERTVVDVLDRPELAGGWEEVLRSIESIEFLDVHKILEYVKLLDNASAAARVGWYLEGRREELQLRDKDLVPFENLVPKSPHYLDRSARGDSVFHRRWNLLVPQSVEKREWDETESDPERNLRSEIEAASAQIGKSKFLARLKTMRDDLDEIMVAESASDRAASDSMRQPEDENPNPKPDGEWRESEP